MAPEKVVAGGQVAQRFRKPHLLLFCKSLQIRLHNPGHLFMSGAVNDFHPRPPLKLAMLQPHLHNFVQKKPVLRARGWGGPFGSHALVSLGREGGWPQETHQPLKSLLLIL